jgi:hypothetical protein
MAGKLCCFGFFLLLALSCLTAVGFANVPDAGMSVVPNVVYDPDGLLSYTVRVRDALGDPVVGALVEIVFSTGADAMVCWCPGQAHPVISTTTNSSGDASVNIFAGGCIDPDSVSAPVEVLANSVSLAVVGAVSTDVWDNNGVYPWQGWTPGGYCTCGLSDAVAHNNPIKYRAYTYCTDLDSDGRVSLVDAVLVTHSITTGAVCPP